jgi:hypothetical protein
MNRLLIGILDIVNKLIAIFIIVSTTLEGYFGDLSTYVGPSYVSYRILWAVIGFILGLVLAGIVSGLIAAIITIAREMAALRELVSVRVWTAPPPR